MLLWNIVKVFADLYIMGNLETHNDMSNINVYPNFLIFESLKSIVHILIYESFLKAMTEIVFLDLNEEYVNWESIGIDSCHANHQKALQK